MGGVWGGGAGWERKGRGGWWLAARAGMENKHVVHVGASTSGGGNFLRPKAVTGEEMVGWTCGDE